MPATIIRLLIAAALLACSFNATADDLATKTAIEKLLVQKLGDGAKPIAVAFSGGKAMLTGKVEERAVQELSEEVAMAVAGVSWRLARSLLAVLRRRIPPALLVERLQVYWGIVRA